jgi:hypothetical protein
MEIYLEPLNFSKERLKEYVDKLRLQLDIQDSLDDLWKISHYDHRAYKLLVVVSLLEGNSIHDKKLLGAIITVTRRSEVFSELRHELIKLLDTEERILSFNDMYIESALMALCNWFRNNKK